MHYDYIFKKNYLIKWLKKKISNPDRYSTSGSNHKKVNKQCLIQCSGDPDFDPMGELALRVCNV